MKLAWVVVVLVCAVLSASAWAQILPFGLTPRAMGMGTAVVGVADDAGAWFENPAGLAAATGIPVREGQDWGNDVVGSYANIAGTPAWGATWSGWTPKNHLGIGVGGLDIGSGTVQIIGGGIGAGLPNMPLSAGLAVVNISTPGPSRTLLDAGLMYRFAQPNKAPIRLGLRVTDLTNEVGLGTMWNVGFGWPATPNLLVAVDVLDLGQAIGSAKINGGAEYIFGEAREYALRVGLVQLFSTDVSLGAGYHRGPWRADFAWINTSPDIWTAGVGVNF